METFVMVLSFAFLCGAAHAAREKRRYPSDWAPDYFAGVFVCASLALSILTLAWRGIV